MVTSRKVRAARALLGWTQELLADKALVALTALKRLESDRLLVRDATRDAVRKALEAAGIVFLSSGRGQGVMLVRQETKKPDEEALTGEDNSRGGGDIDQTEDRRANIRSGTHRRQTDRL
jgi:transcriptional regulator with XRE-family HTH domain